MIDFHTHILPDIDDGSSSVEESVRMIEILSEQGVKKVFLTPHFYAYMSSADRFGEKRNDALKKVISAISEKSIDIELFVGGEVLFFEELWRIENISRFCVKGTNLILIEMPFSSWENSMMESILKLLNKGFVPVIAHFERYIKYGGNKAKIRTLVQSGAYLQMNCSYINNFFTRYTAIKFIKNGMVTFLGTDCHNLSERKPDYKTANDIIRKKLSFRDYERFIAKQNEIIKNAKCVYPEY